MIKKQSDKVTRKMLIDKVEKDLKRAYLDLDISDNSVALTKE